MAWDKEKPDQRDAKAWMEYVRSFNPISWGDNPVYHRDKESFRKGFYNGAGGKLYDGLTWTQKGLKVRIEKYERKRLEMEAKNSKIFEEKYGVLFEDNRPGAWEEEQQEDSLQQEDE